MTRNYPDMRKGGWRWLAIARRAIEGRVNRAGQELAESMGGPGENYLRLCLLPTTEPATNPTQTPDGDRKQWRWLTPPGG